MVDGLVHVTSLANDYYHFRGRVHSRSLVSGSGKRYSLGDKLTIVVAKVDLDSKRIDFQLAKGRAGR